MGGVIKYGMGRSYLPDWGYSEALREIYQNFKDWGEYEQDVVPYEMENRCRVTLSNDYEPDSHEFLKIGESQKRGDSTKNGKHGEGMKMASLVLLRNRCDVRFFYDNVMLVAQWVDDPYLGECFGYSISEGNKQYSGFTVEFDIPMDDFIGYQGSELTDEDVIYSTYIGDLLRKPKGQVYVGGQFVSLVAGLRYAYNFKPEHVALDRDRKVPGSFDVQWAASKILEGWEGFKTKDVTEVDATYMDRVPENVAKRFKPHVAAGKVVFRAGSVQAPERIAKALMKDPVNQKRVAKLRFSLSRKRVPYTILKEFFDKHGLQLSGNGKIDMQVLLKKSKGWRNK